MDSPSKSELTTTLRLGGNEPVQDSASALLSELLDSVSESEKETVDQILKGPADKAMLLIHKGPAKGSRYLITRGGATIGRSQESEIFLDDVTVSRRHAEFRHGAQGWSLRDAGSLNGTYVNRSRVDDRQLKGGDEVQIGKFRFIFLVGVESQA